ncbi:MAG: PAS domain S-box protein [Bacteroidota bacterium]
MLSTIPHVLYIEDDEVDQMAFRRMAKDHTHIFSEYTIANSAEGAIELLQQQHYDVIVTDYNLGDDTAFEVLPSVNETPVIFITGAGDEQLAVKAMKLGCYDYLIKDQSGNYLQVLPITIQNAYRHHQAEIRLKETEARYKLLVESANDIIYRTNFEGFCIYVNEVCVKITGYQREELVGAHFTSIIRIDYRSMAEEFYAERFKEGVDNSYLEFPIIRKDGREIWVGQNVKAIYDSERENFILGFQGVVRDITDKRIAEEKIRQQNEKLERQNKEITEVQELLRKANERLTNTNQNLERIVEERTRSLKKTNKELHMANDELDMFVYRASHDLRGPIARLQGLANLARMEVGQEHVLKYINGLSDSAVEMDVMLTKLLAVNSIKRHQPDFERINLSDFCYELKTDQNDLLDEYKVSLEVRIDENVEIVCDRYLLRFLLEPMIDNAIRYHALESTDRHAVICINQTPQSLLIYIKDNGAGVDHKYRDKIFDMFFIGTVLSHGNGLGLYIANKAADKMNAAIKFSSDQNWSSIFEISFPEH